MDKGKGTRNVICLITHLTLLSLFGLAACDRIAAERSVEIDLSKKIITERDAPPSAEKPLRIAVGAMISPQETNAYYDQMMKYVSKRFGKQIELVQKKTYQEVNDMIERKELDLAFVCSGPYVTGRAKFGMELLVAPLMHGKPFYQAYFIAHHDSPVKDLQGLKGKRFAFSDPNSNTGALVPTYMLAKMGTTPKKFFGSLIYTYSHDNSIRSVSKELVDGASVDGLIYDYYKDRDPEIVRNTKVIFRSPQYGIPPVVVHPDTTQPTKERLRGIFLSMHQDPEGKKILDELMIQKFIVPEDHSYDSVREMQTWIGGSR